MGRHPTLNKLTATIREKNLDVTKLLALRIPQQNGCFAVLCFHIEIQSNILWVVCLTFSPH